MRNIMFFALCVVADAAGAGEIVTVDPQTLIECGPAIASYNPMLSAASAVPGGARDKHNAWTNSLTCRTHGAYRTADGWRMVRTDGMRRMEAVDDQVLSEIRAGAFRTPQGTVDVNSAYQRTVYLLSNPTE